jgi:hypothetical protein
MRAIFGEDWKDLNRKFQHAGAEFRGVPCEAETPRMRRDPVSGSKMAKEPLAAREFPRHYVPQCFNRRFCREGDWA